MKSLFDNKTRLNDDQCDIDSIESQNATIYNYSTMNVYQTNNKDSDKNMKKMKDFFVDNHMTMKDGYGNANGSTIDNDSKLRNDFEMYDRGKQQLFPRLFTGGPNVNRGGFKAEIDSKLSQGLYTSRKETCDIITEKGFDRFEPMNEAVRKSVQNVENIVLPNNFINNGTRDVLSQRDFLENNGYKYDEDFGHWKKQC